MKVELTNEEKVQKYKEEVENVFHTETAINSLNQYDKFVKNGDLDSVSCYDQITLGIRHKEYWVKFEVKEPNLLNSFLMSWIIQGKSIAGVQGSILDFGEVCDKNELKNKLTKMIEEL